MANSYRFILIGACSVVAAFVAASGCSSTGPDQPTNSADPDAGAQLVGASQSALEVAQALTRKQAGLQKLFNEPPKAGLRAAGTLLLPLATSDAVPFDV